MKKAIILGNGFDLRHFLPTSYNHFITILEELENLGFSKDISFEILFGKKFKEQYNISEDDDRRFYDRINEYYDVKKWFLIKKN